MNFYETILMTSTPISALIAVNYGRKVWIRYDIAATSLTTLALVAKPDLFMPAIMTTPVLPYHRFLCALGGVRLLNNLLHPLLMLDSEDEDESVHHGYYFSRVIEHSLIAMENLVAYNVGTSFNFKFLLMFTSGAISHLFCNAYMLWKTPNPRSPSDTPLANLISKIEFYALFMEGCFLYAFPDLVNSTLAGSDTLNEGYRSLTRSAGAFAIGLSIASLKMSKMKFARDKKKFFQSRIIGGLLELAVLFSGHFCFKVYSVKTMGGLMLLNLGYNSLVTYGYMNTPDEPRLKAN